MTSLAHLIKILHTEIYVIEYENKVHLEHFPVLRKTALKL